MRCIVDPNPTVSSKSAPKYISCSLGLQNAKHNAFWSPKEHDMYFGALLLGGVIIFILFVFYRANIWPTNQPDG